MSTLTFARFLSPKGAAAGLLRSIHEGLDASFCIQDASGLVLMGEPPAQEKEKHPILHNSRALGWVTSEKNGAALANLAAYLFGREMERRELASEVLDRYRELNLLYNLSEKLSTSLELRLVAQTTLDEAHRLIRATSGALFLLEEDRQVMEPAAVFGPGFSIQTQVRPGEGIIGSIAQSGRAEVVNGLELDQRRAGAEEQEQALICAPLKGKGKVLGVIVLGNRESSEYSAGDLKLINTLASQASPALENCLFYEKTVREAREREQRLQRQIQELRIELDEARQQKQVEEITETEFFQRLRRQAEELRKIRGV